MFIRNHLTEDLQSSCWLEGRLLQQNVENFHKMEQPGSRDGTYKFMPGFVHPSNFCPIINMRS